MIGHDISYLHTPRAPLATHQHRQSAVLAVSSSCSCRPGAPRDSSAPCAVELGAWCVASGAAGAGVWLVPSSTCYVLPATPIYYRGTCIAHLAHRGVPRAARAHRTPHAPPAAAAPSSAIIAHLAHLTMHICAHLTGPTLGRLAHGLVRRQALATQNKISRTSDFIIS
jgi:hypothetical protein